MIISYIYHRNVSTYRLCVLTNGSPGAIENIFKYHRNLLIFHGNIIIYHRNGFIYWLCVLTNGSPGAIASRMNVEIFSYFVKGGISPVRAMNIWKSLQRNQKPGDGWIREQIFKTKFDFWFLFLILEIVLSRMGEYKSRCSLSWKKHQCSRPNLISDFPSWFWKSGLLRFQIQIFFPRRRDQISRGEETKLAEPDPVA